MSPRQNFLFRRSPVAIGISMLVSHPRLRFAISFQHSDGSTAHSYQSRIQGNLHRHYSKYFDQLLLKTGQAIAGSLSIHYTRKTVHVGQDKCLKERFH